MSGSAPPKLRDRWQADHVLLPACSQGGTEETTTNVQKLNVELLEGLKGLGLVVTSAQVEAAIKTIFPRGIESVDQGEVIRSSVHPFAKARVVEGVSIRTITWHDNCHYLAS